MAKFITLRQGRRKWKSALWDWTPGLRRRAETGHFLSPALRVQNGAASCADRGPASPEGASLTKETRAIADCKISFTMRLKDPAAGRSFTTLMCEYVLRDLRFCMAWESITHLYRQRCCCAAPPRMLKVWDVVGLPAAFVAERQSKSGEICKSFVCSKCQYSFRARPPNELFTAVHISLTESLDSVHIIINDAYCRLRAQGIIRQRFQHRSAPVVPRQCARVCRGNKPVLLATGARARGSRLRRWHANGCVAGSFTVAQGCRNDLEETHFQTFLAWLMNINWVT